MKRNGRRMSFKKYLSIGVIGVGHWGPNIIRNFANHPRVRLRYICDTDGKKLKKASKYIITVKNYGYRFESLE